MSVPQWNTSPPAPKPAAPEEKRKLSPQKVAAKLKKADTLVKIEDLLGEILLEFGGVKSFAQSYVKEYKDAAPGSVAKTRLADGVVRLIQQVAKRETPTAVDEMSDDELDGEIERQIRQVISRTPLAEMVENVQEIVNGPSPTQTK